MRTGLIDASGAGPELASQVNNDSTVTGVTVKDALNTLLGAAGCAKSALSLAVYSHVQKI